jgi:hypothetical protein
MNSRRNFLRNLGGLFAVSLFSPSLLKALERSEGTDSTLKVKDDETLKGLYTWRDSWDEESKEWTEAFFKYLKNNNVGFKWERTFSPVFETKVGRVYQCATHKCANFNPNWEAGVFETKWQSLSAGTSTLFCPRTIEEYRETIFASICSDICRRKRERVYFYQVELTPVMYNPMNFDTVRGVCIRGVEI